MFEKPPIGDGAKDTLASLDAHALISEIDGSAKGVSIGIRLVDDHRRDSSKPGESGPL